MVNKSMQSGLYTAQYYHNITPLYNCRAVLTCTILHNIIPFGIFHTLNSFVVYPSAHPVVTVTLVIADITHTGIPVGVIGMLNMRRGLARHTWKHNNGSEKLVPKKTLSKFTTGISKIMHLALKISVLYSFNGVAYYI